MFTPPLAGFFIGNTAASVRSVAATSAGQDFLLMVTVAGRSGSQRMKGFVTGFDDQAAHRLSIGSVDGHGIAVAHPV